MKEYLDPDDTPVSALRGDAPARVEFWGSNPGTSDIGSKILAENNQTYNQARGFEQRLISMFRGTDDLLNRINGISASNPRRQIHLDAADKIIQTIVSNIPSS